MAFFHAKMTAEARGPRAVPPWRGSAATRRPFHRRETEAAAVMRSESRAGLGRAALPDSQPGPRPAAGMGGSRCPRPAPGRTPATPRGSTRDDTASSGDAAGLEQRRGCGGDPGAAGRCRGLGLRAPQRNSPGPRRSGAGRSGGAPVVPRAAAPSGDRTAAGTAGAGRIGGGVLGKAGSGAVPFPSAVTGIPAFGTTGAVPVPSGRRAVRTGLRAATSSRRLRPHRRGRAGGSGSRGTPEGPARFPRDRAPTGPGEQEWWVPAARRLFPPSPPSQLHPYTWPR